MHKKEEKNKGENREVENREGENYQSGKSQDVSFDEIATKFDKSIYGSTKGKLRHEMLLHNLSDIWEQLPGNARMLDAGGGTGEFTRELLLQNADVVLNDISADTLQLAQEKLGQNSRLSFHHGPIQDIARGAEDQSRGFDFIACHAVFEWLQSPRDVLGHLLDLLQPGGYLSLSFFNRDANLFGNMLYGNFDLINNNMKQKNRLKLASHSPLNPRDVIDWISGMQCTISVRPGSVVFMITSETRHNKIVTTRNYCRWKRNTANKSLIFG